MVALILGVALAAAGCERGSVVEYTTLARAGAAAPGVAVVTDDRQFAALLKTLKPSGPISEAPDFANRVVLAVWAGERPTGGYRLEITDLRLEGHVLWCRVMVVSPTKGAMVTQVLTYPGTIVTISRAALAGHVTVRVVDQTGTPLAETQVDV